MQQLLRELRETPHPDIPIIFKIIAWKVRGLNNLAKRADIVREIKYHKPTLSILVKTKVKEENKDRVIQ